MQEAEDWALTVAVTGSLCSDLPSFLPLVRKVIFTTSPLADFGERPRGSFLKDHCPCLALHLQVWDLLPSQEGYWQVQGPSRSYRAGSQCGGEWMALGSHTGQGKGRCNCWAGATPSTHLAGMEPAKHPG